MTLVSEIDDAMLLDLVRSAVATVLELPIETLYASTRLVDDVDADSLAMIEIVEIVEEELRAKGRDVWIDDQSLARLETLADIGASAATAMAGADLTDSRT
ncbi:MAG TPA: phosphopantetheine-binding protein [Frankiaceae bacterium]|jgi:acyl carrier protein|nr:phosphopantetheine-binding protein [Frankiaceae bacterium]